MALTNEHGADVCTDMIGGEGTETVWTCMAREGRYVAVGFNDDPESGNTGRPLRKVSMGNFSVLGVMMGYNDMPVEFRRFGLNTFPPSVGREVHAALLELVSAGKIRPVIGARDRHGRSRGHARRPRPAPHERSQRRRRRQPMTAFDPTRCSTRRGRPPVSTTSAPTTSGPDSRRCARRSEHDAQLNDLGAAAVPGMVVGSLANRLPGLRLDRAASRGARRAHRGADRRRRDVPSRYDVAEPALRPGPAQPRAADVGSRRQRAAARTGQPPRRSAGRRGARRNAMLAELNPQIEVVHHEQADEATECITVMAQDFKSLTYEAIANVPGYDEWLLGVDHRSAYEYHRWRAAGVAERRRAGPVDAEEPAPRDRARCAHRGVPGCPTRAAAPRSRWC